MKLLDIIKEQLACGAEDDALDVINHVIGENKQLKSKIAELEDALETASYHMADCESLDKIKNLLEQRE